MCSDEGLSFIGSSPIKPLLSLKNEYLIIRGSLKVLVVIIDLQIDFYDHVKHICKVL